MLLYSLQAIIRAARVKAAALPKEGTHCQLIHTNKKHQYPFHKTQEEALRACK